MHSQLLKACNQIIPLDDETINWIITSFKKINLQKGAHFLTAGEVNKYIGFINSGLVRYYVMKNDEESTFEFTKEGEFIADYQSFTRHSASLQYIQAIEDCEILVINFDDLQKIFNQTQHGNLLGRIIIEHRFEVMVNQLLSIYMHHHVDRYKQFVSIYNDLAQRIPQYLIASYVGVKPQSLSRIRKRFTQKD